ncbi:MAG: hypothetical protein LBJ31_01090 [Treponema sp.]|jgi:hypothetical protein|nr:hypothetical protein [Treponema sp.]
MHRFVKRSFVIAAVILAAMVLGSCYSYPINVDRLTSNKQYWDNDLPREQSVELYILYGLKPTSYNGVEVNWGAKPDVFLPPGRAVLTLDLNFTYYYTNYKGNNVFVWDFKAGDRYMLYGWERDGKPGVMLFDMDVKKNEEDQYFFPFPESKIILE